MTIVEHSEKILHVIKFKCVHCHKNHTHTFDENNEGDADISCCNEIYRVHDETTCADNMCASVYKLDRIIRITLDQAVGNLTDRIIAFQRYTIQTEASLYELINEVLCSYALEDVVKPPVEPVFNDSAKYIVHYLLHSYDQCNSFDLGNMESEYGKQDLPGWLAAIKQLAVLSDSQEEAKEQIEWLEKKVKELGKI